MHSTSSSENNAVVGHFLVADAELLLRMLHQLFRAPQQATDVRAHLHVILAPSASCGASSNSRLLRPLAAA